MYSGSQGPPTSGSRITNSVETVDEQPVWETPTLQPIDLVDAQANIDLVDAQANFDPGQPVPEFGACS